MSDQSINPTPKIASTSVSESQNPNCVWDVVIVGAGIAGLTCAQQLQQAGKRVVVVEKSRGFGGRAATKRLPNFRADAGLPYLTRSGALSSAFIDQLLTAGVIRPWQGRFYDDLSPSSTPLNFEPWIAPEGANAIGKYLAKSLTVWRSRRAIKLQPTAQGWQLILEAIPPAKAALDTGTPDTTPLQLTAQAVVLAIPAPQAIELLQTLHHPATGQASGNFSGLTDLTNSLVQVDYDPCLTVIAGFNQRATVAEVTDITTTYWDAIELQHHPQVRWLGIESQKRSLNPDDPWVLTLHSTPSFAKEWLETANVEAIGAQLLHQMAQELNLPHLAHQPDCLIVHRWRYALVQKPAPLPPEAACLSTVLNNGDQAWSLVCCGDWCGDDRVEAALRSAIAAARSILQT